MQPKISKPIVCMSCVCMHWYLNVCMCVTVFIFDRCYYSVSCMELRAESDRPFSYPFCSTHFILQHLQSSTPRE